jgi:prepilin signal peptidase PulO-like enzyme (type II secretory pathway)
MNNEFLSKIILLILLVPITIVDIKTKRIPNLFIYWGFVLLLLIKIFVEKQNVNILLVSLIFAYIPFFLIWFYTKGKLGLGDAKLSAIIGLALGLRSWFSVLFISSIASLVFAVSMLLLKKIDRGTQIPYAPFLSLGVLVSIFFI